MNPTGGPIQTIAKGGRQRSIRKPINRCRCGTARLLPWFQHVEQQAFWDEATRTKC